MISYIPSSLRLHGMVSAARAAELVIWIGYLQQHYRTRTGHPSEPILKDFKNINFGLRGGYDAVLTWDGYPVPTYVEKDGKNVAMYSRAQRPKWPESDFIVGNPSFVGNKKMRDALGETYTLALREVSGDIEKNADFVMQWWVTAAKMMTSISKLKGFRFVTTNSITQNLNRRAVAKQINNGLRLRMAIPDHPWTCMSFAHHGNLG